MARWSVTSLPPSVAVFVGGLLGGALRLSIDALVPSTTTGLPLDIVGINVLGSFAMGVLAAWALVQGSQWWVPLVGTGALGSFTTFSALAAMPWIAEATLAASVSLLIVTTALCVAAAGLGWPLGSRLARGTRSRQKLR